MTTKRIQPATEQTKPGWWVGTNDEYLNIGGPFTTREEAIAAGHHDQGDDPFYICFAALRPWSAPIAHRVMDGWVEQNEDIFYEDGFDSFASKEMEAAAEDDLQTVLNAWFERHKGMLPAGTAFDGTQQGQWLNVAKQEPV